MIIVLVLTVAAAQAQTPELLLFGGRDHRVFLGCLNCGRFDPDSVCNRFGEYGSRFSSRSIWNRFGDYGSRFSPYSPWNRLALYPPVIVDRQGNFYGYFTSNRFHPNRTTIRFFLIFLDNVDEVYEDLERARNLFCNQ
ncbi:MAG: hypothetical protein N0A24_11550 [Armatimonadetes bacterium]|nr:hypothetical protein [Armatimonadota bacterium]MDW8154810.1 hypothetical protein [Armatimonadota bacterium]